MQFNNCDLKYLLSCHEKLVDEVGSQIPCPEDGSNTGYSRKKYRCSLCSSSFSVLAKLKVQMRDHTGEKPYICLVCSKASSHPMAHTGEKRYFCVRCPKSFSCAKNLRLHTRIHSGEKNYHCAQCPKSFSTSSKLRAHMRVHTGEKPGASPLLRVVI